MDKKVIIKNGSWVTDRPEAEMAPDANAVDDEAKSMLRRYEIYGSWWSHYICWSWMQRLSASYFVWKVENKYKRYKKYNGSKKS